MHFSRTTAVPATAIPAAATTSLKTHVALPHLSVTPTLALGLSERRAGEKAHHYLAAFC